MRIVTEAMNLAVERQFLSWILYSAGAAFE